MSARWRGGSLGVAGLASASATNVATDNCSRSSSVIGGQRRRERPIDAFGRWAHKNTADTRSRRRLPNSQCTM